MDEPAPTPQAPDDEMAAVNAAMKSLDQGPAPATGPDTSGTDEMAAVNAAMKSLDQNPAPATASTPHLQPHLRHTPTLYKQAGTPPPVVAPTHGVSTPPPRDLTLAEVAQGAAHNFLPSAAQGISGMVNAVNPFNGGAQQTLSNLGQLGTGALSQFEGAVGVKQDPAQKAKAEKLIGSLESHYKQVYGTSWGNFGRAFATDPFSILMDASMFADPAAGAIGKLGEASKVGAIAKATQIASKAIPYANPVNTALAVAKLPVRMASATLRTLHGVTSGTGSEALELAKDAGKMGGAAQAAFNGVLNDTVSPVDFAETARSALDQIKQEHNAQYMSNHAGLADKPVDFTNTYKALAQARDDLSVGSTDPEAYKSAKEALDAAQVHIDNVASRPPNSTRNVAQADGLKKQIWDLIDNQSNTVAQNKLKMLPFAIKEDIGRVDSNYANMMDQYQHGSNNIKDITKTLGLGNNTAASASLTKMLKNMKTGVPGQNALQQIISKNPAIGGALAGFAVKNHFRGGISVGEALAGAGAFPLIFSSPLHGITGLATGLAASSPRLAGRLSNMSGKASGLLDVANGPAGRAATLGAYAASRPDALRDVGPQNNETNPSPPIAGAVGAPKPLVGSDTPDTVVPTQELPGTGTFTPEIAQRMAANPTDPMVRARVGIASNESNGQGDYRAQGPVITNSKTGQPDQALGRYQVMASHLADWTKKYLGEALSKEQFLASPEAQEKVFEGAFGDNLRAAGGNLDDAISMWFSGRPLGDALAHNAHDVNEGVGKYVNDAHAAMKRWDELHGLFASGGRVARASGGSVSDIEPLVGRLMKMATSAKKASDEVTKPLLKAPDNAIVHALDVAQQAI